ncbi:MAG: hypothetical protein ACO3B3_10265 [Cyanobium sp.]|jgi:hypothetical protein
MASDPLDALRLTLMQEVLPVGMAVVERVRKGGPREVLAAFEGDAADPLDRLRREGEPAASQLRQTLDRLQPGLGNPVMKVDVRDVPAEPVATAADPLQAGGPRVSAAGASDPAELLEALARITARLDALEQRLG